MEVKTFAQWVGVKVESVIHHEKLDGADIIRIDLTNEPELRDSIKTGGATQARLPDGDLFSTAYLLDGTPRTFSAQRMFKYRSFDFADENHVPKPAWHLRAQALPPTSAYGAVVEYIGFFIFDHYSEQEFDLASPADIFQENMLNYALAYMESADSIVFIKKSATAGTFTPIQDFTGHNAMLMTGKFSNVQIEMPNCHKYLPFAPDHRFTVLLSSGSYYLKGTWGNPR